MENNRRRGIVLKLLLVLVLVQPVNVSSQSKVDSLVHALNIAKVDTVKMKLYIQLGNQYIYTSHTDALACYSNAKALAEKNNDQKRLILSVIGLCDVYGLVGEYKKEIHTISEALDGLTLKNNYLLALCYGRLATAYANLGKDSVAHTYDLISLKYNMLEDYKLGMAYDYGNIATYFINHEKYDSANYYLDLCLATLPDTADALYPTILGNKAFIKRKKELWSESLTLLYEVLALYKEQKLLYYIADTEHSIADVYYNQNMLDSAYYYVNSSLEICAKLNNHELYKNNYNLLNLLCEKKEDFKMALKYSRLEFAYLDSVNSKNNENIIASIKAKHEFEEQRKELDIIELKNEKLSEQQRLLIVFSIIALILLITSVVTLLLKYAEHIKNKALVVELDKVNRSIRKLLSIIGHDLKDSVANLKNFTQLMHYQLLDNKSIDKMVSRFIPMVNSTHSLLETLLIWTRSNEEAFNLNLEEIRSNELVDLCTEQLSHLANTKHILLKQNVEGLNFKGDKNMLLITLRNVLCNAIKFSELHSEIIIHASVKNDMIEFAVQDFGVGMTSEEMEKVLDENVTHFSEGTMGERGSGLGLALCSSFITKHGGKFSISSVKGQGSTFSFVVPIKY